MENFNWDDFFDDISDDSQSVNSEEEASVIGEEGAIARDKLYTELLTKFSDNYDLTKKQSKTQKTVFFSVVLVFLGILLITGIVILFIALFNCSICNVAVVIGASVDILGAFIAIPTIIAKHLFPEKIDNDVIEVVKQLVRNDKHIRELKEKHNKKVAKIK